MNHSARPAEGGGLPAPAGGSLLVPTLVFGFYLMAAASGGVLLMAGGRVFGLVAGWTALATLAMVVAIALGAIVGGTLAGRQAVRTGAPGFSLALLQTAFGLTAVLSVLLFRVGRAGYLILWPAVGSTEGLTWGLRFLLAMALFFLPALFFFGMMPMLARLIVAGSQGFGVSCGFTIGLTLAGLGLGLLVEGSLFLPGLGIEGSFLIGLALAGIAAAGTTLVAQRGVEGPGSLAANLAGEEPSPAASSSDEVLIDEEIIAGGTLAASIMLVGFTAWAFMIAWARTLSFIVGGTLESRAMVAAVFLIGLAIGSFLVAGFAERAGSLMALLAALLASSSIVAWISMRLIPPAAGLYLRLSPLLARPGLDLLPGLLTAASVMLPACVLLGGALPLLPLVSRARGRPMSGTIAFLAVGVMLAELTVGLMVVPAFGLRRTVSMAGAVVLLSAILFLGGVPFQRRALRATITIALLGMMVVLGGFPATWDPRVVVAGLYRYGPRLLQRYGTVEGYLASRRGVDVLSYREGRNSTAVVERTLQRTTPGLPPVETLALTIDGRVEATTGDDIRAQILQAHIPILVHGPTESVLLIDFLNGVTAGSILRHPVRSLKILEREPALFGAAPAFADYNNRPLEDSRVARIVDEARARLAADRAAYDVILVAAIDPWLPQSASLLTSEGYGLLKSRLRPGGLLAQRLSLSATTEPALKAILRTFARTFDSILVFQASPEDLLVLGSKEPLALDVGWLKNVLGSSASVAQDMARVLPLGVNGILLTFRMGGDGLRSVLGDGPTNGDDHSPVEVASYRPLTVHDNSRFVEAIDTTWAGVTPFLKNYGATPGERADFLYALAKAYLGAAADPLRAREIAGELSGLGRPAMARWVTGECLLQQRDIDGALGEWRAVLHGDPDNLDALFSLGTYYQDNDDHSQAESYLARAARLYADAPVVLYTHGRNLYLLGRYREAIAELRRLDQMPGGKDEYPLIDYIIGVSLHKLGEESGAADTLEAYLKWAYAQNMLTRLEVDAHLKLSEVYEKQGKRFKAQQEKQKGDELLRKIQNYAQRVGGTAAGSHEKP